MPLKQPPPKRTATGARFNGTFSDTTNFQGDVFLKLGITDDIALLGGEDPDERKKRI
jgi:hypothetical protein